MTSSDEAKCPMREYPFESDRPLAPPAEWAELRETCPVADVRLVSGDTAVVLTRYDDVKTVLADPRFTRQLDREQGAARISTQESGGIFEQADPERNAIASGEGHRRWRRLLNRSFTAKRVNSMRPGMTAIANSLVDELVAGPRPPDIIAGFGFPLPVRVICELLGVPAQDWPRFAYWSDTMLSTTRYTDAEIQAAQLEFAQYIDAHIERCRQQPGDDLISELIAISDTGEGLSHGELQLTAMGLLVAGHETTASMIGKMLAILLADRSQWEALLADRALVRTAVEEVLRFDPNPGFGLPRFVTEDLELGETSIAAGTTVLTTMAANRDPRAFDNADQLDLARSPNPHLSFGVGPHSCLGQALARTELQVTLEVLLERLPGLRLAVPVEQLERRTGLLVGGFVTLPVEW
ncbi:cytochrome P450 [Kribbella deserti]|uniref:Cytochrome P450 n=1 Tax=Kribbella deserti TaxID=1926257 RepID=A0ABV6QLR3_9ACTN